MGLRLYLPLGHFNVNFGPLNGKKNVGLYPAYA